jgi:hypothetical protein
LEAPGLKSLPWGNGHFGEIVGLRANPEALWSVAFPKEPLVIIEA